MASMHTRAASAGNVNTYAAAETSAATVIGIGGLPPAAALSPVRASRRGGAASPRRSRQSSPLTANRTNSSPNPTVSMAVANCMPYTTFTLQETLSDLSQNTALVTQNFLQFQKDIAERRAEYAALTLEYLSIQEASVNALTGSLEVLIGTQRKLIDKCLKLDKILSQSYTQVQQQVDDAFSKLVSVERFIDDMLRQPGTRLVKR